MATEDSTQITIKLREFAPEIVLTSIYKLQSNNLAKVKVTTTTATTTTTT